MDKKFNLREAGIKTFYDITADKEVRMLKPTPISGNVTYAVGGKFKPLTRVYVLKNTEVNEEFYSVALPLIGGKYRLESDQINGLFNLSLEGEDIILTEVLED